MDARTTHRIVEEDVAAWRFDELVRAGFEERDALRLAAEPGVDLHLARELLGAGCPRELALRILR